MTPGDLERIIASAMAGSGDGSVGWPRRCNVAFVYPADPFIHVAKLMPRQVGGVYYMGWRSYRCSLIVYAYCM